MEMKTFELSSSMNFLVIDDNESYRVAIGAILKKLGFHEIQMANSSMTALKILRESIIDLVICERNMPEIDGALLLKEMRESFDILGCAFLMMGSGTKVTKEDLVLLSEYEVDGFITKPFNQKSFMEKITQCIEHYKNPKNIEFIIATGKHKLKMERADEALRIFERLLESNPNSARIRVCLARCYRDINELPKALQFVLEALEKNSQYPQTYDELGKIYLMENKIPEAMSAFSSGIEISPKYPIRYEYLIEILYRKELYAEALIFLEKAQANKIYFENFEMRFGQTLFFLRKLEKAIIHLERALTIDGNDKGLLNIVGICLKDLGKKEEALKHYNMALKKYPNDGRIMYNKAICLISLARFDQAQKLLKYILTIEPDNQKVIKKLEEISQNSV